ncbi:hypothetical protein COOONC_13530 [Cooperia oncophora]
MRVRRPPPADADQPREGDILAKKGYSGELVKGTDQRYRQIKGRAEEPALETALGRVSDLVPLEDAIDTHYPAQRIIISNFVRNGCRIKRWLYEDAYPINCPRPSIGDLVCSGPTKIVEYF